MDESHGTIADSAVLVAVRAGFFVACQRFLLATLNPTLRDISGPEGVAVLPAPATQIASSSSRPTNLSLDVDGDSDADYSSYPGSPAPRAPGQSYFESNQEVELQALSGRKVLNLSHGKESVSKALKKETRGLSRAARVLFSLCIAESCTLLTLVMLHAIGILAVRSRHVNFSASLHILLAMILIILPFEQCLLFTYRKKSSAKAPLSIYTRIAIALVPFGLYGFLFTRVPPYITIEGGGSEWTGWLAPSVGRVVVMGVLILAGLSGFGAVRTAWTFYEHSRKRDIIREEDIAQAERALVRIRQDLQAKQRENAPEASWMRRVFGGGSELAGLQAIEYQASRQLGMMRQRKVRQDFARTFSGRCYNVLGYVFAIYCGARVLMCLPSLFFSTSSIQSETEAKGNVNGDWISLLIAFALSKLPIEIDIPVWSRAISLAFTGLIILSSLAQILRSLTRILKLTSKSVGAGFLLLSLGQLFATYVISLLVQLRTTIPGSPDDQDSLLSPLPDFQVFGRLFDITFLVASVGTLVFRFVALKVTEETIHR